jgi:integrase
VAKGNLTDRAVAAARPRETVYRLSDGGGLLLQVKPGGGKSWTVRLTQGGRRRDVGLGPYPEIGLADARRRAIEARRLALEGLDPAGERDLARRRAAEAQAAEIAALREADQGTFEVMLRETITSRAASWRSGRTADIWESTFARHVLPTLGGVPVAKIDARAIADAFRSVWQSAPGLADRLLDRTAAVLKFAAARGFKATPAAADRRELVRAGLLPPLAAGKRFPALPWERLPDFWRALDAERGLAARALELLILTAQRSGSIREARWGWLDFTGNASLVIPADAMKRRLEEDQAPHRVPLPPAALDVLARAFTVATGAPAAAEDLPTIARRMGADALIFPSARDTPFSDVALLAVVRRMNGAATPPPWADRDGRACVPHGFRASFSGWIDDTCPAERETAERQLAHVIGNRASAAYRRGDVFERRAALMAQWCRFATGADAAADAGPAARKRRARATT